MQQKEDEQISNQSMDEIYRQHAQRVYRFLLAKTRDADLSEELTQETFYQAIRSSSRYDGSCKISTWLCAIAQNVLHTYQRKHPPTEVLDEGEESCQITSSAEDDVFASMRQVELMKYLHACEEPYREVLYLRIFGNLAFQEIGEIMGKSENWARVTFYRAKEKLRKQIEEK